MINIQARRHDSFWKQSYKTKQLQIAAGEWNICTTILNSDLFLVSQGDARRVNKKEGFHYGYIQEQLFYTAEKKLKA